MAAPLATTKALTFRLLFHRAKKDTSGGVSQVFFLRTVLVKIGLCHTDRPEGQSADGTKKLQRPRILIERQPKQTCLLKPQPAIQTRIHLYVWTGLLRGYACSRAGSPFSKPSEGAKKGTGAEDRGGCQRNPVLAQEK